MGIEYNVAIYEENRRKLQNAIRRTASMYSKYADTPLMMSILVTNRCQLHCRHCFNASLQNSDCAKSGPEELTIDQYRKISSSMGIIMKGIFSGGEPFLREDLAEIVSLFQKNNRIIWTSLSTNGQDTQSVFQTIEKILINAPHQHLSLAFSLDGFLEYHEYIRGKGTFDRCLQTWKECQKLKKYPHYDQYICTTINTVNQQILPAFLHWCIKELEPSMVSVLKTRQHPRDGDHLKNVNVDWYRQCREAVEWEIRQGNMGDVNIPQTYMNSWICRHVEETLQTGKRSFHCYAGQYGGFLQYDGSVGVCEVLPPIGNLADYAYNFRELWNSRHAQSCRKAVDQYGECHACTHETEGMIPSLFFGRNATSPLSPDREEG